MSEVINYKKYRDLDEARLEASKEVGESGAARQFPVVIFNQGTRTFLSAVFPVVYIVNDLKSKPTEKAKGVYDVKSSMNRPLDPAHARNTKEYLKRNFKDVYILPPMTLNIQEPINIYTTDYQASVKQGHMVIPYGVKLSITDGQHRQRALEDLCKELSEDEFNIIKNDGISVMITVENDIDQIHQDFADCSKTKLLPKSLIAVYDKRNPANSLVNDLIEQCPLFKNKIDASSNTLSKKSTKLLLASQVRSGIKELLVGSSAMGDVEFEKRAIELYVDSESKEYKNDVGKYIDYINRLTQKIPILKQVAEMKDSIQLTKIPALRSEYLILNSAGLNLLCRIGHYILQDEDKRAKMDMYIDRLGQIDWKKSAPIWHGNIIATGNRGLKIATSNSTLKAAVEVVKRKIGLTDEPVSNLSKTISNLTQSKAEGTSLDVVSLLNLINKKT